MNNDGSGSEKATHIRSFALRGGRFSKAQQSAYERLGPEFIVDTKGREPYSFSSIFRNENPVIVEIGFGSGSATAEIAENRRDINYLGIEVFKPGIGNLLKLIEEKNLTNIRIAEGDAYEILRDKIGKSVLRGVHVFFPDPWPKKRHHKRRLIRPDFTAILVQSLAQGGYRLSRTQGPRLGTGFSQQVRRICSPPFLAAGNAVPPERGR
mgnify:CR=1 FL=1